MRQLFVALCFWSLNISAQDDQGVLTNVIFHSDYERAQFERFFIDKESNYLELFVASDPTGNASLSKTIATKLDNALNEGLISKLNKKTNAKKVKSLYETIHKELLDKYEAKNNFSNLINTGSYNCVTATALYALAFEKLDIPYVLQEKPTHVYALAYPATEQILVESTDPISGFISFNERFKSMYIERMTNAKVIGSEERNNKSIENLFNEYYFKDTDVNIVELIGIQYMNQGVYAMNKMKQSEALMHFEKAYLFYPNENIGSVVLISRLQKLASGKHTADDAVTLSKLEKQKDLGATHEMILNEFKRAMYNLLTENSNAQGAHDYYKTLIANIRNDTLSKDISYSYSYERARVFHNQGNYDSSLVYASKAIKLKPQSRNSEDLFIGSLAQKFRSISDYRLIQQEFEKYAEQHKQLLDNNLFSSMLANTYLVLFAQSYDFRKLKEAEMYHSKFKELYKSGMNIDQNNVGRAYSIAAVYYFRLGNKRKALQLIDEGLSIAPDNHELQTRKRMIH